jgi:hypothetical protein
VVAARGDVVRDIDAFEGSIDGGRIAKITAPYLELIAEHRARLLGVVREQYDVASGR